MLPSRLSLLLLAFTTTTLSGAPLSAQAPTAQLTAVLAQMDTTSKSFRSATASFTQDTVTKVAHMTDTTHQTGSMFLERDGKGGASFGAALYEAGNTATPSRIIDYSNGAMRLYTPAEKQVDRFNAGANQTTYESFLTLGFGGSGHDLAQAWQITDGGPETLTDNGHPVKTEKLILLSKDPGVRNTFRQVTLWIDPTRDISLKQVFETPSGEQRTAVYTNIRLNGKVNKTPFIIPTKGITVVPH